MALFQPITRFFFIYYLLCTLYTKANNSWRDHYKNIVQCKTNMKTQSRVHISIIFCKAKASVFVTISLIVPNDRVNALYANQSTSKHTKHFFSFSWFTFIVTKLHTIVNVEIFTSYFAWVVSAYYKRGRYKQLKHNFGQGQLCDIFW